MCSKIGHKADTSKCSVYKKVLTKARKTENQKKRHSEKMAMEHKVKQIKEPMDEASPEQPEQCRWRN